MQPGGACFSHICYTRFLLTPPCSQMCILAGCDFLPNLQGVGIKKAHALVRKHRDFVKVRQAE